MNDDQKKVRELLDGMRFAMFTTTTEDGALVSRPMTVQEIDEEMRLLFIAQRDSTVARQADGKAVNLAFADGGSYVSMAGSVEVLEDVALKQRLWNPANDAYTTGGPENPNNVVLAVSAESAEYWDSPAAPVQRLSMAKALLTGEKPQAGEHGAVEL